MKHSGTDITSLQKIPTGYFLITAFTEIPIIQTNIATQILFTTEIIVTSVCVTEH